MSQEIRIKDGTGQSFYGKVNHHNRQVVEAVTSDVGIVSLLNGNSFSLPSQVINTTNTTELPLLYFAHSETEDTLLGRKMILWSSESTGGTESTVKLKFYVGSTGIAGGVDFTPLAAAVGSTKALSGDFQRGLFGSTLTGGVKVTEHIVPIGEPYILDFNALYGKDVSLAVTVVPPAGNTSIDFSYILNTELINIKHY